MYGWPMLPITIVNVKIVKSPYRLIYYVRILNRIDALLTEKKLKTKIVFLIYEELLWAPQKEEILNPDRFVMMFAPISRTFKKSYQMPKELPASPAYVRNKITLPVNLEENLSFLSQWQKAFNGECFDYDYPLGRAHYGDMGYVHISKIIYDDIKYLKELHFRRLYQLSGASGIFT